MEFIWEVTVEKLDQTGEAWYEAEYLIKMDNVENFDLVEAVKAYCCDEDDDEVYLLSARIKGVVAESKTTSKTPSVVKIQH